MESHHSDDVPPWSRHDDVYHATCNSFVAWATSSIPESELILILLHDQLSHTGTEVKKADTSEIKIVRRDDGLPLFPDIELKQLSNEAIGTLVEGFFIYTWGNLVIISYYNVS